MNMMLRLVGGVPGTIRSHQVPTLLDQQTQKPPGERTEVGRAGPSASQSGRFVAAPEGADLVGICRDYGLLVHYLTIWNPHESGQD